MIRNWAPPPPSSSFFLAVLLVPVEKTVASISTLNIIDRVGAFTYGVYPRRFQEGGLWVGVGSCGIALKLWGVEIEKGFSRVVLLLRCSLHFSCFILAFNNTSLFEKRQ